MLLSKEEQLKIEKKFKKPNCPFELIEEYISMRIQINTELYLRDIYDHYYMYIPSYDIFKDNYKKYGMPHYADKLWQTSDNRVILTHTKGLGNIDDYPMYRGYNYFMSTGIQVFTGNNMLGKYTVNCDYEG